MQRIMGKTYTVIIKLNTCIIISVFGDFQPMENNASNICITDLPVDNKVCLCRQCRSFHAFYDNRIRSCNKAR